MAFHELKKLVCLYLAVMNYLPMISARLLAVI